MTKLASRKKMPFIVGPQHNGKRMSLAMFDRVEVEPGYLVELGSGVIEVSEIPSRLHVLVEAEVRKQFTPYELAYPEVIHYQAAGQANKLQSESLESESLNSMKHLNLKHLNH